ARRLVDQVEQPAGNAWPAMTNIGYRPSLAHSTAPAERVEVHLLGFSGDLYGAELEFEFVRRLREERAFPDLDALRAQIERDRADSHAALEGSTPDFGGARSESGPAC
ncbi:MAG TPA: riboflavin kinase, partial [Planctomycetota bacterium]|nr:riboflavin kinase [Planctomycetota bacterium]